jgi:anti-anti-sigma regulatory factor
MSTPRALPPEEDLFVRIVLHNKLVTDEQCEECIQGVLDEVFAGRLRPSLASVFIEKNYLSSAAVAAVQKAVAKSLGTETSGGSTPGTARRKAPVGDSQVLVPVKDRSETRDRRFLIANPERGKSASLTIDCHRLAGSDGATLEAYCRRLIATGKKELNIDMRRVDTIPSLVIGVLVKTGADAKVSGQRVVLHCNPATAKVVRMIAGERIQIRVSKPPPDGGVRSGG